MGWVMLKFLGNFIWRNLGKKETPGADIGRLQNRIDHEVIAFCATDWSSGFVGYALDNNALWYSERHSAQDLR